MARRTELQGIVHDVIDAFVSRNNDLNGYWALGQLRNWIEDEGGALLDIPLLGERLSKINAQVSPLSRRFTAMLKFLTEGKNLPFEWVDEAYFTVELAGPDRLSCSFRIVSDLGRSFEAIPILLVRRHCLSRESKRYTAT